MRSWSLVLVLGASLFPGLHLAAATIQVPGDEPTIQAGIDDAAAGDTVLVAPGTYTGEGNRDIDFGGKDLVLRSSGGAAVTVIDVEYDGGVTYTCDVPDPHRGFYLHSGEGPAAVIEGFHITRGGVGGYTEGRGAGLLCQNASPTIRGCRFSLNIACVGGGAIALRDGSSLQLSETAFDRNQAGWYGNGGGIGADASCSPTITACQFRDNFAGFDSPEAPGGEGGAICCGAASVTDCDFIGNSSGAGAGAITCEAGTVIQNCRFESNRGGNEGGAIYCEDGVLIEDCCFRGNSGGGVSMYDAPAGGAIACGSSTIRGCVFQENSAVAGGAISCSGSPAVSHCLFAGNLVWNFGWGGPGHGAAVAGGSPTILSCTFWGNSADGYCCGVLFTRYGTATVTNCVIAGSVGLEAVCCEYEAAQMSCCDIYGNQNGDWAGCIADQLGQRGNFSADPLFCDPEHGDFTLAADSPCLGGPACGLIGAFGLGCGASTSVGESAGVPSSWGRVKRLFETPVK